jgi:hypothetical protein
MVKRKKIRAEISNSISLFRVPPPGRSTKGQKVSWQVGIS